MFVPKENKDAIRWIANIFALAGLLVSHPAGALVLGAALRARLQVHGGRAQQLDPFDRRRLRPRHRRHFLPADHADHAAGLDFDPLLVDRDRESREGILHLVSGAADRHAGRLHGARFLPLLRFLGSHAGAHVPADRHLGRPAKALRRHQVLPLHPGRLGADAACHSVPVLLQLHVRPASYTFSIQALYKTAPQIFHDPAYGSHVRHRCCSWHSSWPSPSRCRCSRSTPGCRMPTWKRPPPVRSSWPAFC